MTAADDLNEVLEQYRLASAEFVKGNPEPYKMVFSHQEDVTFANPYGPPVRGWEQVAEVMEHAASRLRDGQFVGSEIVAKYLTAEFAYVVQLVREKAKIGGNDNISSIALRVTMIFRPEDGAWNVVHLHADPITTAQPAESVIQE